MKEHDNRVIPQKYIDLLIDYSFKRAFGTEPNKDILISFLNSVFQDKLSIADLVFNKTDFPGDLNGTRGVVFDLHCTDSKGNQFIVEVQRLNQKFFKDRSVLYACRHISEHALKGPQAEGLHHLTPLYMVAILEDFKLDKINTPSYISHKCLCDSDTGEIFYDKLNFIFIELVKFEKAELELQTNLDKWLYLLKHLGRLDQKPQAMNNPIFEKLLRIAEYENLNREERAMYDESLKYKRDLINQTNFAVEEAVGIAIEVSEAEREKAIESKKRAVESEKRAVESEKRSQESEKRSQDARKESVRVLKRKGFTPNEIAEISGFTLEEISEIHG